MYKYLTILMVALVVLAMPGRIWADESVPPQVESAVDRALKWLAAQQKPDGEFPAAAGPRPAIVSLSVMAFLARGHVPGQGPYGETINKGIDWILNHQDAQSGLFATSNGMGNPMYDHGASTVMLGEAYGMVDDTRKKRLDAAIGKAAKLILDAQKIPQGPFAGGWRYTPTSADADISCTGWQLMALRGAANCGAVVPESALKAGVAFVRRNASAGGGFDYTPGSGPNQARTGTGILSMELLGQHNSPEAVAAGDYLLRHPMNNPNDQFFFYGAYYCSQAVNQLGGKYYDGFYPTLRDTLLALQDKDGHWSPSAAEAQAGPCYATGMAVLALCVPYRYLPLYQR